MKGSLAERFWARVEKGAGCWIWKGAISRWGYGAIGSGSKVLKAHRVSWELANGRSVPDGMAILHSCHNRACVNPAHLRPGTPADNVADMMAAGRECRGEATVTARLNIDNVKFIRTALAAGVGQEELARTYDVARTTISAIATGRSWKRA